MYTASCSHGVSGSKYGATLLVRRHRPSKICKSAAGSCDPGCPYGVAFDPREAALAKSTTNVGLPRSL